MKDSIRSFRLESEPHSRSCVRHNKRKAVLALLVSAAMVLYIWRELGKPFPGEPAPLFVRLGLVYAVSLITYFFVIIRCKQERLWLGLALTDGLIMLGELFFPSLVTPAIKGVRGLSLLLWLGAAVVSLSFVKSAFIRRSKTV